jgi:hypothetical protein
MAVVQIGEQPWLGGIPTEGLAGDQIGRRIALLEDVREGPEVTQADIVNVIWSNGRIMDATSVTAPNAWRRYRYRMLDAYDAERAHPLPKPPITDRQLYDAMVHLGEPD